MATSSSTNTMSLYYTVDNPKLEDHFDIKFDVVHEMSDPHNYLFRDIRAKKMKLVTVIIQAAVSNESVESKNKCLRVDESISSVG